MTEKLGRYEILEEIGQGGFAIVYRARDTELDRLVALKELKPILLQDTSWVKRFRREARAIARLDHPRIVTIHDVGEAEGRLFIVMRLVDGPSLEELITRQGCLPWSETVEIITAVAEGLDYAHAHGILHRDLKPANILMDSERGPMLTDFGLAKLTGESSMSMSGSGSVVGTPHYIAPEVWEGQTATSQADIYAMGCVLYEILTGEKVFKGETPPAVMMAHFRPLVLPERWPEGVPAGVAKVLKTTLATKPENRYTTAGEMANALAMLAQAELAETYPASEEMESEFAGEQRQPDTVELPAQIHSQQPDNGDGTEQKEAASEPAASIPSVTPAPPPVTPVRQGQKRSACLWIGLGVVGLVLLVIVGTGTVCSTVGSIFNAALPTVEVGSTVSEPIRVPMPAGSDTVNLEIELGSGELLLAPGAEGGLVEGTITYNVEQLKPNIVTTDRKIRLQPESGIGMAGMFTDELENRWDLKLGPAPMALTIDAEATQGRLELGGLSLADLIIKQGMADFELSFSEPNRITMDTLQFKAGASKASLTGLANARAEDIIFDGGAGDYTLDFSGELQGDLDVRVAVGLSNVVIIVPEDVAAEVSVNGNLSDVKERGAWRKSRDDYYVLLGEGDRITIDVEMGPGSLELRNR